MSRKKTQKVLVPKGTIDPGEDTVIEIPQYLHGQTMVIAKKTMSERSIRTSRSDKSLREYPEEKIKDCCESLKSKSKAIGVDSFRNHSYHNHSRATQTLQESVLNDLRTTEETEKYLLQKRLEEFQEARRQFLLETTNLAASSKRNDIPDQSMLLRPNVMSRTQPPSFFSPPMMQQYPRNVTLPANFASESFDVPQGSCSSTLRPETTYFSKADTQTQTAPLPMTPRRDHIDSSYLSANINPRRFSSSTSQTTENTLIMNSTMPHDQTQRSCPVLRHSLEDKTFIREPVLPTCMHHSGPSKHCPLSGRKSLEIGKPNIRYDLQQTESSISREDIERLKQQFDESRKMLEDAIALATESVYNRTKYCPPQGINLSQYDSQPVRDQTVPTKRSASRSKCCASTKCKSSNKSTEDEYKEFEEDIIHSSSFSQADARRSSKENGFTDVSHTRKVEESRMACHPFGRQQDVKKFECPSKNSKSLESCKCSSSVKFVKCPSEKVLRGSESSYEFEDSVYSADSASMHFSTEENV